MPQRTGMGAERAASCSCCVDLRAVTRRLSRWPSCTVRPCLLFAAELRSLSRGATLAVRHCRCRQLHSRSLVTSTTRIAWPELLRRVRLQPSRPLVGAYCAEWAGADGPHQDRCRSGASGTAGRGLCQRARHGHTTGRPHRDRGAGTGLGHAGGSPRAPCHAGFAPSPLSQLHLLLCSCSW